MPAYTKVSVLTIATKDELALLRVPEGDHFRDEFAHHVNSVLAERGEQTTDLDSKAVRNAEQSAHLETVCIGISGLEIDMNRLRKEKYKPTSRIPDIESGTLFDDAMRRDISINALFLKFGEGENEYVVEDPIGRGLDDLEAGIIRTNIDPVVSFSDDPLRMLRAVRYATRYNFRFEPAVKETYNHPKVREQFRTVLSRQLVMRELCKMMNQDERAASLRALAAVGNKLHSGVLSSFLNDVIPVHEILKDAFNVAPEVSDFVCYDCGLMAKNNWRTTIIQAQ